MISSFHAFVLGAVQGLTEFLPISSSAHLTIIPWLMRWPDPGLAFDVALHLGTLAALLAYYRREWTAMGLALFSRDPDRRRLLLLLIVASVPGAVVGLALEHQAESAFRSPPLIALALAALGAALWLIDRDRPQRRTVGEMTYLDALAIGLSQALAIVPGVSRSGATITMGRIVRMHRGDAATFSFLMATPIIAGAGLVELRKIMHTALGWPTIVGFLASALFGWVAIAALLRFVQTRTYAVFAWYRLAVAALIVCVYLIRA
jgi:undecaprenyl-diphosphatase